MVAITDSSSGRKLARYRKNPVARVAIEAGFATRLCVQPYTNPQALVDSFSDTYRRTARSYLASADARANGRLVTLGPVEVQAAFGVEHRKEDLRDLRPPFQKARYLDLFATWYLGRLQAHGS